MIVVGRKKTKQPKQPSFQHAINEVIVYVGLLYEKYNKEECIVVSRSKKSKQEYYRVRFNDGIEHELTVKALIKKNLDLAEAK
jgi:hypothetical protein